MYETVGGLIRISTVLTGDCHRCSSLLGHLGCIHLGHQQTINNVEDRPHAQQQIL